MSPSKEECLSVPWCSVVVCHYLILIYCLYFLTETAVKKQEIGEWEWECWQLHFRWCGCFMCMCWTASCLPLGPSGGDWLGEVSLNPFLSSVTVVSVWSGLVKPGAVAVMWRKSLLVILYAVTTTNKKLCYFAIRARPTHLYDAVLKTD